MIKARNENGTVRIYRQLPTRYLINGVPHNLSKLPVSVAEAEGFHNVVEVIPDIFTVMFMNMEAIPWFTSHGIPTSWPPCSNLFTWLTRHCRSAGCVP